MLSLAVAEGSTESGKGCWDLVEVNCAANEAHNSEWNLVRAEPQEVRGEKEINWEESSLAKFSHFLGLDSTIFLYSHRFDTFSLIAGTVFRYSYGFYLFPLLARILPFLDRKSVV